jgi:AraC-like DNA-binding protein
MLSSRQAFKRDGIEVAEVSCRHPRGRGEATEHAGRHIVVFVRRGCFIRSVRGFETLLDPTVAYCMNPGEEQRYDHPYEHGDDCTAVSLDASIVASLWGGEPSVPAEPLPISPRMELEHRLLLARARRQDDPHELVERAIALAACALEVASPGRVAAARPATAHARRALVDGVREALASRPETSLPELARQLAVSPHHLSRVFKAATGHTISRHRMRLRVSGAFERLAGGERDLSRLAADLGFSDHAHMCRVVRDETGCVPSGLRAALG